MTVVPVVPAPSAFLVLRPEARLEYVGPFPSEAAAVAWIEEDERLHGSWSDWTIWPLHSPAAAAAFAAGGEG